MKTFIHRAHAFMFSPVVSSIVVLAALTSTPSFAIDLDWTGQFRADSQWVFGYPLSGQQTPTLPQSGYRIVPGGDNAAQFQSLFMRLNPSIVVNDNVYIKSEWWLGSPVYGFYGSSLPYSVDQRWYNDTYSAGSAITAQRYWGEFVGDFGVIQIGRVPLNWGLGVVWNNGSKIWDRYMSTGDAFRIVSKFGAFSVTPSIVKYGLGSSLGGNCVITPGSVDPLSGTPCSPRFGNGGVSDYSIALEYANPDEDLSAGVNFIRRVGGASGDNSSMVTGNGSVGAASGTTSPGLSYNLWDIFAKKRVGKLSLGAEIPVVTGYLGGTPYSTVAAAAEVGYKASDAWEFNFLFGRAPGQPNIATANPDKYTAFYFHHAYRVGLIMFNYALQNFVGPNSQNNPVVSGGGVVSPYDNPVTNANYLSFGGAYKMERWSLRSNFVVAGAANTADAGGYYYNTWRRQFEATNAGVAAQQSFLGWEMDYGVTFKWDDHVNFDFDLGWYFPGAFYAYSNDATNGLNPISSVFAMNFRVGVGF